MDKHTHIDFKGLTDWVEIFKAGKQTDSKGRTQEFTASDLDQVVANLDPAHPPKHVITHRELYSPFGYGDIVELKREGDALFAKSGNIEPQFDALVKNGRLPERSVRLVPSNNGWKLGHLAWLGAEPPAVEGLAPVQYSANADDVFEYRMHNDWYTPNTLGRLMRRMRDFLIEKFGKDEADSVIADWEIESITEHTADIRNEDEPTGSLFSSPENGGSDVTTYTQDQLDDAARKAADKAKADAELDFAKQQKDKDDELQKERHERRLMEFRHEVSGLVTDNKLTPAQAAGCAEFMASLAAGDEAAFDFSAGDGDDKKDLNKEPVQWFRDFMAAMPAHKLDEEVGGGGDGGVDLDDANAIASRALEYQKTQADSGITISMAQAVSHVTKGDK